MQFSPRLMLPLMAAHATVCLIQGPVSQFVKGWELPQRVEQSIAPLAPPLPPIVSQWLRSPSR
jgi:hypothetical protein